MSTYEEMVVDRAIEAAWLAFKVRLADHLAAAEPGERFEWALPTLDDQRGRIVMAMGVSTDGHIFVLVEYERDGARRDVALPGLRRLGIKCGGSTIDRDDLDAFIAGLTVWLRGHRRVVDPSFLTVLMGQFRPADVAEPAPASGAAEPLHLPEAVVPHRHADLLAWLDLALEHRLGRKPTKSDSGGYTLTRDERRVYISPSSNRPIIDVWAVVARDVDVRRARKAIAKLNAKKYFFSFSLVGDRIDVRTTVNGQPFCPAHLNRAINSTFAFLETEAGDVAVKVRRRDVDNSRRA